MVRTRFEAGIAKRQNVNESEKQGIVADSLDVRMALIEKMNRGEMTLDEVQTELKRIKRNAKKNGQITRSQAWKQG